MALPRLGVSAGRFGICATEASLESLLPRRFRAAATQDPGPVLIVGDGFVASGEGRPVVKAMTCLPGGTGSDRLLVSDGWPLPTSPDPAAAAVSGDLARLLSATRGRPTVLLGLRLLNSQPAASVCRALLAINDGPVELHDLRIP
ncbi:MAG: hypothetical protein QNJ30_02670 [Kiloniellales bacterium]|nr:hypothetical protein [Kiloniellales bacterium]